MMFEPLFYCHSVSACIYSLFCFFYDKGNIEQTNQTSRARAKMHVPPCYNIWLRAPGVWLNCDWLTFVFSDTSWHMQNLGAVTIWLTDQENEVDKAIKQEAINTAPKWNIIIKFSPCTFQFKILF